MNIEINETRRAINVLAGKIGRPVRLMEVCGTHTVAVFRNGIRSLLPENISLLSGPGCPVCVTSTRDMDIAIEISRQPGLTMTTFGDMIRVPGSETSLGGAKAEGADVRVVYSPLDALGIAMEEKGRKVVFFATGFETTSPLVAATVMNAVKDGVDNFFIHSVHKLVPPALAALMDSGEANVDGLMLPGHVSAIIGSRPYEYVSEKYRVPSVITGFGPLDILEGILMLLAQIHSGRPSVQIQYGSAVKEDGNPRAVAIMNEVFRVTEVNWRGIGSLPESGLALRDKYTSSDITGAFEIPFDIPERPEPKGCSCGEVLRGIKTPTECPLFARSCTPENPVGACMVSSEGSCAAYYRYAGANANGADTDEGKKSSG
jgi:hydrogenase expression/formation protein HypD